MEVVFLTSRLRAVRDLLAAVLSRCAITFGILLQKKEKVSYKIGKKIASLIKRSWIWMNGIVYTTNVDYCHFRWLKFCPYRVMHHQLVPRLDFIKSYLNNCPDTSHTNLRKKDNGARIAPSNTHNAKLATFCQSKVNRSFPKVKSKPKSSQLARVKKSISQKPRATTLFTGVYDFSCLSQHLSYSYLVVIQIKTRMMKSFCPLEHFHASFVCLDCRDVWRLWRWAPNE